MLQEIPEALKELRSWNGEVYLSVLNELDGSPANLDVQTASNLDLAKVRKGGFRISVENRRQICPFRLVVQSNGHQRERFYDAQAVLQAPAKELRVAGWHDDPRPGKRTS